MVNYEKLCPKLKAFLSGCIDYDAEFYGTRTVIATHSNIYRWQECQKLCKGTANCVSFEFDVRNKLIWNFVVPDS